MRPLVVLVLSLLSLQAFAADTDAKRPLNIQDAIEQINGSPRGGTSVAVSTTKATVSGLDKGGQYLVWCDAAGAMVLPGDEISPSSAGSIGERLGQYEKKYVLLKQSESSMSFIMASGGATSATCVYHLVQ